MRISIFRNGHFNAAHRLHNPNWSDVKNKSFFGLCNNPNYHGHNYEITVKITGDIDEETGMLINLEELKHIIQLNVLDKLDHKNLNLDVPEFKVLNPTAENICYVIWQILRKNLEERFDIQVRLYETPRNFVEFPA